MGWGEEMGRILKLSTKKLAPHSNILPVMIIGHFTQERKKEEDQRKLAQKLHVFLS